MKNILIILVHFFVILTSSFCMQSCNSSEKNELLSRHREEKFYSEKDLLFLMNINNEILNKMKAADINELESAILADDEKLICQILGYTSDEMEKIYTQITKASYNLMNDYPEIKEEIEARKKRKCIECEFNLAESFELLKANNFKNIEVLNRSSLKTRSEADDCIDGTSYIFCCIACAAAPVTVWAYPACCLACYYAFC